MKCPYCNSENTRVIDSRPVEDDFVIRRRRHCDVCNRRFTTYEKVEAIPLMVVKKDNSRQAYDRAKIERGIINACHKRTVPVDQIEQLVTEIENELFENDEKEIKSSRIGEMVMEKIRSLDEVAYVRFASVYREFKDASTFLEELERLKKKQKEE